MTGASRGIGRGVRARARRRGRRRRRRQPVAAGARRWPGRSARRRRRPPTRARATSRDGRALRRAVRGARGAVDVVVNAAGVNHPEPVGAITERALDAMLALNVRGTLLACQAAGAVDARGAARPGAIVNLSSQMGHVGAPLRVAYCATKHAVEGMTKALAVELAPRRHPRQRGRADVRADAGDRGDARRAGVPRAGSTERIPQGRIGTRRARSPPRCSSSPRTPRRSSRARACAVDGGWTAQ